MACPVQLGSVPCAIPALLQKRNWSVLNAITLRGQDGGNIVESTNATIVTVVTECDNAQPSIMLIKAVVYLLHNIYNVYGNDHTL